MRRQSAMTRSVIKRPELLLVTILSVNKNDPNYYDDHDGRFWQTSQVHGIFFFCSFYSILPITLIIYLTPPHSNP